MIQSDTLVRQSFFPSLANIYITINSRKIIMKPYQRNTSFFLVIIITGLLNACGGANGTPVSSSFTGELISVSKLSTRSKVAINNSLLSQGATQISAQYDVDTYKVLYKTRDTQGELITVSGLMTIPKKSAGMSSPLLSYQHGTILLDGDAPSFNHQAYDTEVIAASLGYIVVSPYYIGYGESAGRMHPHTHAETLAGTSIDLIRAGKTWLAQQSIKENKQLFLMGYSEGGYATYAMQKQIQETLSDEFTVTASMPSASAYNLTETKDIMIDGSVNTFLFYGYIIKSMDFSYQLNQLSSMIQTPYLNVLNNFYDGKHSGSEITSALPPSGSLASDFFTPDYYQKLIDGEQTLVTDKLAENNIDGWIPTAPTRFFQNKQDELVPFSPVVNLVNTLKSQGADVDLIECYANGLETTHGNCFLPSMFYTATFFKQYARDL